MSVRTDGRGGARRVARTLRDRAARLGGAHVRIGVFGGQHSEDPRFSLPEVLSVHEYGTKDGHVPARRPLRITLDRKRAAISAMAAGLARAVIEGKTAARPALEALGQFVAAEVKKTITTGPPLSPPLSPETVASRARVSGAGQKRKHAGPLLARPLVHTGQLVKAITHLVVEGPAR